MTISSLWLNLLTVVERQGVNCNVTHHATHLDVEQSVTGQYTEAYDSSTIKMIFDDPQAALNVTGAGLHSQVTASARCYDNVLDGDEVTDGFGNVWRVSSSEPYTVGDVYVYRRLKLFLKFVAGQGGVHPPATGRKRFKLRVYDEALFTSVDFYVKVIDLNPISGGHVFPFTYPFVLA